MKQYILKIVIFIVLPFLSFGQTSNFKQKEATIDSIMKSIIILKGKKPVHNFLFYGKNEKTGFEVNKGVGVIGRNDTPIDQEYQYNIASITKPFVATIILQLEEEGKLKITDKAITYLANDPSVKFEKINYFSDISIEMLLNHTSGIADIFTDAETKFNISVFLHKKRQYTTKMLMERFYKYKLNEKYFKKPGEGYHYSDMNYMMLGFIIEKITHQSLQQAIRERILEPLKMTNTYFEYYESQHGNNKRADSYLNRINMTKDINTSYEWAGGGLVSTSKELGVFIEALFDLKLFKSQKTLNKMIDVTATKELGAHYGLGLYKYDYDGKIYFGHGGFYGSILAYNPADKIIISANIGQAFAPFDTGKLIMDLLKIIEEPQEIVTTKNVSKI